MLPPALRTPLREPVFALAVVLTLALAIGTNAATFGLVSQLMLAPPPGVADAARVAQVRLRHETEHGAYRASTTSYPAFRAIAESEAFARVAASRADTLTVGRAPDLGRLAVRGVSGDWFATLGARPRLGRFFGADEDVPGGAAPVAVLSHAYWQRAYGGDASVLGSRLTIDDRAFTVVGVAAPGFVGDGAQGVDAFLPLSATLAGTSGWTDEPGLNLLEIVVRLRDEAGTASAARAAATASGALAAVVPGERTPTLELAPLVPGAEARETPQARVALWLAGVSVVILLVATASVGTLFSLRWARRRREVAVRLALGAGRAHLARALLAESLLLAAAGAALGLLLSGWLSAASRATLLPHLARTDAVADRRVLLASVVMALVAGAIAGLAPLLQHGQANLAARLAAGGGPSQRLGLLRALVGVQIALGTLLLVGAALFVRSLERVRDQDLGLATSRLLVVTLEFRGYVPAAERDAAHRAALDRVRALAAVDGATAAGGIPFGPHHIPPLSVPGMAEMPNVNGQIPIMYAATPEYLALMGVTTVRGRAIAARDDAGAAPVLLVNETMARRVWPGRDAIGQCVRVGFGPGGLESPGNPADGAPCRTVIGVVRDSRARSLRPEGGEDRLMQYYVPLAQAPAAPMPDVPRIMLLLVRARGDLAVAASQVQRAIHASSARPLYAHVRAYDDLLAPQLRPWRLGATVFSAFGLLALAITVVGVFGVVSYAAAQRTRELGIRLALGGTRARVAGLVVADALRVAAVGAAAGAMAALLAGPLVAPMLFQTSPREPASLGLAIGCLLGATLLATAWPAWKASRTHPAVALRSEG